MTKKMVFGLVLVAVLGFGTCATQSASKAIKLADSTQYLTKDEADAWAHRMSNEVYDGFASDIESSVMVIGYGSSKPNSANGVDTIIAWTNIGVKEIKYITFTVTPFNAVNDQVVSSIGSKSTLQLKITGPCPVNKNWSKISSSHWENVWYNQTIDHIRIDRIEIIYMDNTSETISGDKLAKIIMPEETRKRAMALSSSDFVSDFLPEYKIKEIQTLLAKRGYYNGDINGKKDETIIKAANDARQHYGLPYPLNGLGESLIYFLEKEN